MGSLLKMTIENKNHQSKSTSYIISVSIVIFIEHVTYESVVVELLI